MAVFMISVRFPYALTSQAAQPELGFNALDALRASEKQTFITE